MKGLKTGGRKAGTPNKRTQELKDLAMKIGVHPFKFLLLLVKGDLRDFGYIFPEDEIYDPEVDQEKDEEDRGDNLRFDKKVKAMLPKHMVPLDLRTEAARDLLPYLYPRLKALEEGEESESDGKIHFVSKDEFNKAKEN